MTPEMTIWLINSIFVLVSYFFIYPIFVKDDRKKLLKFDIGISLVAFIIAWRLYSGSEIKFDLILFKTDWFWFSLITYLIAEMIAFRGYLKIYKV